MQNSSELADAVEVVHSLQYVSFPHRYDLLHLLTNFEYCWKEIQFEQWFWVQRRAMLFINWHFVDILGIPTRDREKCFVCVRSWWSNYEESQLLVESTRMVFAHQLILALHSERRRLFLYRRGEASCFHSAVIFNVGPGQGTGRLYSSVSGCHGSY